LPMARVVLNNYIEHGGAHCPYCGSAQISGDGIDHDRGLIYQDVACNSCDKTWTDKYTLIDILES